MSPSPRLLLALACPAALALFLTACSEEKSSPPSAVDTFCVVGDKACAGNYLAECADEGKAWKLTFCGESKSCIGGANPACKPVICVGGKGARTCSSNKVMQCEPDGVEEAYAAKTCASDETCKAGSCVPAACSSGVEQCGWGALLTCESGAWQASKCASQQFCDTTKLACIDRNCVPTTARCLNKNTAETCSISGEGWDAKPCPAGELCYDGVCHREVKGATPSGTEDAAVDAGGEPDTIVVQKDVGAPVFSDIGVKDIKFDEESTLSVIFSETASPPADAKPIEFDIVGASYLSNDQMLQITGDVDLNKIEIQIAPVEEFQTGGFTALGGEADKATILMNDGSALPGDLQWRFQASEYSITLTKFEDTEGRVIGTFNGELKDALDKTKLWYLIDGKFNVIRK